MKEKLMMELSGNVQKVVQEVQLDLLNQLIRVCEKHHLRFYPCGGTLLGCIRHEGFIPWDDDIDVDMPRKDFDKLCSLAAAEFQSPVFLQTAESDPGYFSGHAKLRNSSTTEIIPEDMMFDYDKGIFIDIFPLDHIPDNSIRADWHCVQLFLLRNLIILGSPAYYAYPHKMIVRLFHPVCELLYRKATLRKLNQIYERLCRKYSGHKKARRIAPVSAFPLRKAVRWEPELFESFEYKRFESISLPVPASYDTILCRQFGDYRTPKREKSQHTIVFVSPFLPWRQYMEDNRQMSDKGGTKD